MDFYKKMVTETNVLEVEKSSVAPSSAEEEMEETVELDDICDDVDAVY